MDKTQNRWSFIVNIIYLLIFVGAFYLFMKYAFWTLFPFMCAFVIAALLQKPLRFLTKNKHVPKGIVSTVLSLLVYAVIIGLIAVVGVKLVSSVRDLITYFTDRCSNLAEFFDVIKNGYLNLDLADRLPSYVNDYVISLIDELNDYVVNGELVSAITSNISKLVSPLGSVISTVPSFLAAFLIAIVSTCFMTVEYSKLKAFVVRQLSPERRLKASKTKHILISSVGKMCRAYGLIILITTCELYIGLNILKLIGVNSGTHNLLISFLTALVDIVPVLGTGTVVIPWSIYCFITGNIGMGIGLLVIYVVITVIRQIIEPKLVAGQVGISPIVTIMAMYIGIKLFGAIGIFILPFFVIIIKLLNDEGIIHLFVSNPEDTVNKSAETESESFFDRFKKKAPEGKNGGNPKKEEKQEKQENTDNTENSEDKE